MSAWAVIVETIADEFSDIAELYQAVRVTLRLLLAALLGALLGYEREHSGKAAGVPAYKLLGGKVQQRLRVYANGWTEGVEKSPASYAKRTKELVAKGYTYKQVESPAPIPGGAFGWGVANGDFTGDGENDLLVPQSQPQQGGTAFGTPPNQV